MLVLGADVNEVNVDSVDPGNELRQSVEPRFDLSPVIVGLPVAHQLLHGRERHALRVVIDRLLVWPPHHCEASAKVDEIGFRDVDLEWPYWCIRPSGQGPGARRG